MVWFSRWLENDAFFWDLAQVQSHIQLDRRPTTVQSNLLIILSNAQPNLVHRHKRSSLVPHKLKKNTSILEQHGPASITSYSR